VSNRHALVPRRAPSVSLLGADRERDPCGFVVDARLVETVVMADLCLYCGVFGPPEWLDLTFVRLDDAMPLRVRVRLASLGTVRELRAGDNYRLSLRPWSATSPEPGPRWLAARLTPIPVANFQH
jgi:hypothetical protein